MRRSRQLARLSLALLMPVLAGTACRPSSEPPSDSATDADRGLTANELAALPTPSDSVDGDDSTQAAAGNGGPRLRLASESGYVNERGQYVIDLLERDYAYLNVAVFDAAGHPVRGARPTFQIQGSSRVDIADRATTDDIGGLDFGVIGGRLGADVITVTVGDDHAELIVNLINLKAAGYPPIAVVEGALSWDELQRTRVHYERERAVAEFPAVIAARHGQRVKIAGFMLPLDPDERQKHFLLTSNPPSCFFHVPGGPAGAVEIFSEPGIVASTDPIALEGRFETLRSNEQGIVYRLRDARLIQP